jgi:hypothetical protein
MAETYNVVLLLFINKSNKLDTFWTKYQSSLKQGFLIIHNYPILKKRQKLIIRLIKSTVQSVLRLEVTVVTKK